MSEPVGLIGLGLLGSAMCDRLIAAGFELVGFDVDAARRDRFAKVGGIVAPRAASVAVKCRRILLSLPDSSVSARVVAEIRPCLMKGAVIVDTTTGDPVEMAALGADLAANGCAYVDATIAGSSEQVRNGDVVVLMGGQKSVLDECGDVLKAISATRIICGSTGSGARMKLVVNLVLGLNRAVLAEGINFAEALGFLPGVALEVLRRSPAASSVMESKGKKMIERDFAPQARLRQHLKDVRLILKAAENGITPLSELHAELLQSLVDRGFGEEDNSAIIRAFE